MSPTPVTTLRSLGSGNRIHDLGGVRLGLRFAVTTLRSIDSGSHIPDLGGEVRPEAFRQERDCR